MMRTTPLSTLSTLSILLLTFAGCGSPDVPQSEEPTSPPAVADSISPANVPAGTYSVDRNHTYLSFSYLHLGYTYPQLRFTSIDGELHLNGESMADSTVAIAIDTDSIDTKLPRFDRELRSLQYFNAEEYPKITFTSSAYETTGPTTGRLEGLLTIKGRTRPVSLDVTLNNALQHPMLEVPAIGFSATGTILRSDWGLSRNIPFVADEVNVRIEIEFLHGANESSSEAARIALQATAAAEA